MSFSDKQWADYFQTCELEKRERQKDVKDSQNALIGWNVIHQLNFKDKNLSRWEIFFKTGEGIPIRQDMFARYIGLINTKHKITDAGIKLLDHNMEVVWQQQIEKWYYCVDKFHRPCYNSYHLYPFFALLKVLLLIGDNNSYTSPRYSISFDEFRFFVVTIKDYSECNTRKEMILDFRTNPTRFSVKLNNIFGDMNNSKTCYDRVIHLIERTDYLTFNSDSVVLKDGVLGSARELINGFEYLTNENKLPTYVTNKNLFFTMLYSEKSIFQFFNYIAPKIDLLVDESILIIENDEDFSDEDEIEYEIKVDTVITKEMSAEERAEKARVFLDKYKEKLPNAPIIITKKYVKKVERGPVGRFVKNIYNSICQIEDCNFTFEKKDGTNYGEAHHLESLGDGGRDIEKNIVVLCANCHRKFHYATVEKESQDDNKLVVKINGETKTIKFKP